QADSSPTFFGDIDGGPEVGGVRAFASMVNCRVMQKQFIALLGMILWSHMALAGQMSVPQLVPAQEQGASIVTMHRAVATHWRAARFLLYQDPGVIPVHFSLAFGGAYEGDPILQHLSPMDEIKTLTLTQSLLPLVRFWGGRLQLDAFQ